jgi:glucose-1-phosphate adenylyltransferase
MADTHIGYHSIVERSVLDENVNIGKLCYVGFGASLVPGNWEITVLGKDVTIPDGTAIGRNCKILPRVGPTDLTSRVIPSGSIVSKTTASASRVEGKR